MDNEQVIKTEKGFFIKKAPKIETAEEKIARLEQQIQQDNLIQFEVLATIYEELMASKGSV